MDMDEVVSPLDPVAVGRYLKERDEKGYMVRVREVCVCGHSVNYHKDLSDGTGRRACKVGQQFCACSEMRAVLRTDNLRLFMHTTSGVGDKHALGKGLVSCLIKGASFEWLESPLTCDSCNELVDAPVPVSFSELNGEIRVMVTQSGKRNFIYCPTCYAEKIKPLRTA